MICLLEERVCNLVLLWCITVIAHHCKLVKLQSSISDYRPSDLWSYDDIEVARPLNESTIRLVKNHHGEAYYVKSDDRKNTRLNDQDPRDDLPSLRNRDHFGSRTNIEIPIGPKSNDGEISISKKITFNGGNNSRSNNHPLWFNNLEKSAMSLPASISFNLKNLYGERKSESTKRPYENPGVIFASKTIPLNNTAFNRNKMKYQQPNYEPEYEETGLPPSLPNLEIIPFVASDALDKPKETPADRKEGIEYMEDETTPSDAAAMIKKFSPPVLTEGGFVPRDPTLDELYYEAKFNRTYSTPPHIMLTEMTSEYRVTESAPKVPEISSENVQLQYIEYTPSSPSTTHKSTTTTPTTTTSTTTTPPPPPSTSTTTTTTTEAPSTTSAGPPTPVIHFITTKAVNFTALAALIRQTSITSTTSTTSTTTSTTTEDPSIEESEESEEEEPEGGEDEETIPLSESEPLNNEPVVNNTKEEPAEPEDNSLLSNILTMIFDDYPAPNKGKTTVPPPPSKKPTFAVKSTTPSIRPSSTSLPPFKHVYIPPSSTTSTTTTTTTESTSTVKSMDKMGFISTKFSNNNTSTSMNETQQNQIKYVSLPQTFTYNQPVPKTTPKPIIKERPQSHNEIYHSMKTDSVISGLLKLSGCNIFGKMYKTGEQIDELTEPCSRCICSEAGVHCIQTKC